MVVNLAELERMLASDGVGGDPGAIQKATEDSQGLGLFVRSLLGLDRGAAKEAFAEFLAGKTRIRSTSSTWSSTT
jgi:type I restriction enzyme R subunit